MRSIEFALHSEDYEVTPNLGNICCLQCTIFLPFRGLRGHPKSGQHFVAVCEATFSIMFAPRSEVYEVTQNLGNISFLCAMQHVNILSKGLQSNPKFG